MTLLLFIAYLLITNQYAAACISMVIFLCVVMAGLEWDPTRDGALQIKSEVNYAGPFLIVSLVALMGYLIGSLTNEQEVTSYRFIPMDRSKIFDEPISVNVYDMNTGITIN